MELAEKGKKGVFATLKSLSVSDVEKLVYQPKTHKYDYI